MTPTAAAAKPETKVATPPPTLAEARVALGEHVLAAVPWNKLFPSPLNPRKAHNAEADAELAEAILAQGLLENLVARPRLKGKAGEFELIAGERRHRAIGMLIKRGAKGWVETIELPVKVRPASDRELLEIGTIENVQRESLTPLEEAHAFKALEDQGVIVVEIAKKIGKNRRFVEQRLSLVKRLHKDAQKAVEAGTLNVTQARALAQAPVAKQPEVLKEIIAPRWAEERLVTEAEILNAVRERLVPTTAAWFDLKLYKGELTPHPDKKNVGCFEDIAQFERLQKQFINDKLATLRKKWHWAAVVDNHHNSSLPYHYAMNPGNPKCGALIVIDEHDGKYKVYEGVVDTGNPARGGAGSSSGGRSTPARKTGPSEYFNSFGFGSACRDVKIKATRLALLADETMALRLLALNIGRSIGNYYRADGLASVLVRNQKCGLDHPASDPAGAAVAKTIGGLTKGQALWGKLQKLDKAQLVALLADMAAACAIIESEPGRSTDRPFDLQIARDAKANVAGIWDWKKNAGPFLAVCGRRQLYWLCRDLGIKVRSDAEPKTMRPLLRKAKPPAGYVPPWLRLLDANGIDKALKAPRTVTVPAAEPLSPGAEFKRQKVKAKAAARKAAKKKGGR